MDFDNAKENIQPLASGRNARFLEAALHPDQSYHEQLLKQKNEYEDAIRNYTGNDPLQPWYDYIAWIEQSYPSGGKESGLEEALFKCLQQFEKDERYIQDRRLVKLFIKYIDSQPNPIEFYEELYNEGIGTMVADFYICWAYHYDINSNFKKAESVYRKGLDARAQPIELLDEAHKHFGFTMSQRILHKEEGVYEQEFLEIMREKRFALTSLKSHGKKVGSIRSGSAIKNYTPGKIQVDRIKSGGKKNLQVNVFDDQNRDSNLPSCSKVIEDKAEANSGTSHFRSIIDSARKQENIIEPGPWSKAKMSSHKSIDFTTKTHELGFDICEDDDKQPPIPLPPELNNFAKGIQLPKDFICKNKPQKEWNVAVTLELTTVGRAIAQYEKFYLYPKPNQEYSPEELRAYRLFDKNGISNCALMKRLKPIWSNVYETGIRLFPQFKRKNDPQPEFKTNCYIPEVLDDKLQFGIKLSEIYPEISNTELQFEEIFYKKWKRGERKIKFSIDTTVFCQEDMEETNCEGYELGYSRRSILPSRKSLIPSLSTTERKSNISLQKDVSCASNAISTSLKESDAGNLSNARRCSVIIPNPLNTTTSQSLVENNAEQKFEIYEETNTNGDQNIKAKNLVAPNLGTQKKSPLNVIATASDYDKVVIVDEPSLVPEPCVIKQNIENFEIYEDDKDSNVDFQFKAHESNGQQCYKSSEPITLQPIAFGPITSSVAKPAMDNFNIYEDDKNNMKEEFKFKAPKPVNQQRLKSLASVPIQEEMKRPSTSTTFDMNETCTTQTFNLFLKPQSASTPETKKKVEKSVFTNAVKDMVPGPVSLFKKENNLITKSPDEEETMKKVEQNVFINAIEDMVPRRVSLFEKENNLITKSPDEEGTMKKVGQNIFINAAEDMVPRRVSLIEKENNLITKSPDEEEQHNNLPFVLQTCQGLTLQSKQLSAIMETTEPTHASSGTGTVSTNKSLDYHSSSPESENEILQKKQQSQGAVPKLSSSKIIQTDSLEKLENQQLQPQEREKSILGTPMVFKTSTFVNKEETVPSLLSMNVFEEKTDTVPKSFLVPLRTPSTLMTPTLKEPIELKKSPSLINFDESINNYQFNIANSCSLPTEIQAKTVANFDDLMEKPNELLNFEDEGAVGGIPNFSILTDNLPKQQTPLEISTSFIDFSTFKKTLPTLAAELKSKPEMQQSMVNASTSILDLSLSAKKIQSILPKPIIECNAVNKSNIESSKSVTQFKMPLNQILSKSAIEHVNPNTIDKSVSKSLNIPTTSVRSTIVCGEKQEQQYAKSKDWEQLSSIFQACSLEPIQKEKSFHNIDQLPPNTSGTESCIVVKSQHRQSIFSKFSEISKRQSQYSQSIVTNENESNSYENDDVFNAENSIYVNFKPKENIHVWSEDSVENREEIKVLQIESFNKYVQNDCDLNQTRQALDEYLHDNYINPFKKELIQALLDNADFIGYLKANKPDCLLLNKIHYLRKNDVIEVNGKRFEIQNKIGEGSYGTIFCGKEKTSGKMYAFKQEKPPNLWEYCICLELNNRIQNLEFMISAFMNIEFAVIANNASILIYNYSKYGSLISVCNKVRQKSSRNLDENIVMILSSQMLSAIDHLHACNIIHADIKADNFLLMSPLTYGDKRPVIQLIDFGCAIDMEQFADGQKFNYKLTTNEFKCIEMREDRPWTYQIDLYGLAGVIHALLFGKYMNVEKQAGGWKPTTNIPRYYKKILWQKIFMELLNIPNCETLPNLQMLKTNLEEEIQGNQKIVREKILQFNTYINS